MRILYNIGIVLYTWAINIASIKNKKAKEWVRGRKYIFAALKLQLKQYDKIIWIHCASLGEFEQGRPLIEYLKKNKPEYKILLTFFSPSGYQIRRNYNFADYVYYLPADTPWNVKRFLDIVDPVYIFFIKYEFWFNYIHEANKRNIPFYSTSCIFRENQFIFNKHADWFRKELSNITYFFTQDEKSKQLLNSININQCEVFGDTRFDAVINIEENNIHNPLIERFCADHFIIVAGSSWQADENLLIQLLLQKNDCKIILAPHEIDESHLKQIQSMFSSFGCVFYTDIHQNANFDSIKVLVINTIGLLSSLYAYGNIAYIGGGFGKGIHNILEAATYGMPIVFGPNYSQFKEARDLIELQGAFPIHNEDELLNIIKKLSTDKPLYGSSSSTTKNYVLSKKGVTEKIISFVFNH